MPKLHKKKPSKEPIQATIDAISHDGRGITTIDGKTTFIDYALPDEEVRFIYTNKHSKFDEGKMLDVIKASTKRVEPKCQHFGVCGGCCLQHIAPKEQIALKQKTLLEQLQHFGHCQPRKVLEPLTGPVWNYRHKARLGVRYVEKKEKVLVGFRETNGRYIADISRCEVLHPSVANLFEPLQQLISQLSIFRDIAQIEVAVGDSKNNAETALIFRHLKPFSQDDEILLKAFSETHQLYIFLQPGGLDTTHLFANPTPHYSVQQDQKLLQYDFPEYDLKFHFHPQDFSQVNVDINRQMIKRALVLLDPQSNDRILDLFCGFGNFTLPLARRCANIIGVEGSPISVKRADYNATLNHVNNATFYCADLTKNFTSPRIEMSWAQQKYDKLLIDPPRSGALNIMQQIDQFSARLILYISCNPATLARDAGELVHNHNYQLVNAGVMDMFPHTAHVESIALFMRR